MHILNGVDNVASSTAACLLTQTSTKK